MTSKWTDIALILSSLAFLILGSVFLQGSLSIAANVNSRYLIFGCFAFSAIFGTAELVKIVLSYIRFNVPELNIDEVSSIADPCLKLNKINILYIQEGEWYPKRKSTRKGQSCIDNIDVEVDS